MIERADQTELGVGGQCARIDTLGGEFVAGARGFAAATGVTGQTQRQDDEMRKLQ